MEIDKFRSRNFRLLLYPLEDSTHLACLEKIKTLPECEYIYISHNKDLNDDDTLKKEHTHVILVFRNARWSTSLSNELGIELNYIMKCDYLNESLSYLIHLNSPDKYLYNYTDTIGSILLKKKLLNIVKKYDSIDDSLFLNDIIGYIYDYSCFLSYHNLYKYICDKGYISTYRRYYTIIKDYLFEHNSKYI